MSTIEEARERVLEKINRIPGSDAVTLDKADVRALLDATEPPAQLSAEPAPWMPRQRDGRRPMTLNLDDLEALYLNDKERPTGTIGRDHVLALIANLREAKQGETEWEYGHDCDESRATHHKNPSPQNPWQSMGTCTSATDYRRRKASPWLPVPDTTNNESEDKR